MCPRGTCHIPKILESRHLGEGFLFFFACSGHLNLGYGMEDLTVHEHLSLLAPPPPICISDWWWLPWPEDQ